MSVSKGGKTFRSSSDARATRCYRLRIYRSHAHCHRYRTACLCCALLCVLPHGFARKREIASIKFVPTLSLLWYGTLSLLCSPGAEVAWGVSDPQTYFTKLFGSVVVHRTSVREVDGSNSGRTNTQGLKIIKEKVLPNL